MTNPKCIYCGDGGMEPYQENSYCEHRGGKKTICIPYYCENCEGWTTVFSIVKPKRELNRINFNDPKTLEKFKRNKL